MNENVLAKLKVLAESAKYDVSCSSSGTVRRNQSGTLGNTVGGWGICHSFAEDGRCISLLKIMLTNYCIYDCAYCINRRSNDIPRATLSVSELVDLTIEFYRRNYIEGLFLSSGVVRNPDYTMERLVRVAKDLRLVHKFNGYIHLKSIPGASRELVNEAGLYADRLSVKLNLYNTRILLVLIYTAWRTPVLTWIMEGFFRKLPMEIVEAGIIDGCSKSKAFYKLILPISQPGIVSAALLSAVYVWNDYLVSSSFITASEKKMISVGLYQYITQYGIKWGLLMAAVMISIIPIIILFICLQKRFVEGMAAGAVKG